MNEQYCECLVKRKTPYYFYAVYPLTIVVCVILWLAAFMGFGIFAMVPALAVSAGVYFLNRNSKVEYEYVYVGGDTSFDKIMGQSKRKRLCTYSLDKTEVVAPMDSHMLDEYKNKQLKVKDFTSKEPDRKVYVMIVTEGNEMIKILFEPSERLLGMMRYAAPRKVSL